MTRNSIIIVILFLVLLLLTNGCDSTGAGVNNGSTTYAIGEFGPSGVGIVFYVTDGGLHGLEAAPVDQSSGTSWSNVTDTLVGTGTAIGDGSTNTDDITSQVGHNTSAAQICRDYRAAEEGDWFLPSKDELFELYTERIAVGGFSDSDYWSSSENTSEEVSYKPFNADHWGSGGKALNYLRVRAVRAF